MQQTTTVLTDDVSLAELQKAVEHMHGVPERFVEAVEVDERREGKPVWQGGTVKIFDFTGHLKGAKCASHRKKSGRDGSVAADATRRGVTRLRNQIAV
jgi:hypothetical protein